MKSERLHNHPKVKAADRNNAAVFFDRRAVENDLKGGAPFLAKSSEISRRFPAGFRRKNNEHL